MFLGCLLNQAFGGNPQTRMEAAHDSNTQGALAIQHLVDAIQTANHWLEFFPMGFVAGREI
jgi:hypothetical protein